MSIIFMRIISKTDLFNINGMMSLKLHPWEIKLKKKSQTCKAGGTLLNGWILSILPLQNQHQ